MHDMWKTKKADLKKLFKGQDIDLEHLSENLQMITMEISDRPMTMLLKAELHEKMELAELFNLNYLQMFDFVKEATKTAERIA